MSTCFRKFRIWSLEHVYFIKRTVVYGCTLDWQSKHHQHVVRSTTLVYIMVSPPENVCVLCWAFLSTLYKASWHPSVASDVPLNHSLKWLTLFSCNSIYIRAEETLMSLPFYDLNLEAFLDDLEVVEYTAIKNMSPLFILSVWRWIQLRENLFIKCKRFSS